MAKFLHIADIHLGFDRYDTPERTKDFFRAFQDVLRRYALEAAVDFVLIAGDLFEHRNIQPATLNQAQLALRTLKAANIPVLAIEGNHDNRPYGTRTSWLKYLAEWDLLILLEPGDVNGGEAFYRPWDGTTRRGGYLDLDCGVRVLGANWYGAASPKALEQIAAAIAELPQGPESTVLMFHHGLEGQIARYSGALRYQDILPVRQAGVDYLALGHIHKHYSIENWVFNPGSLEANNIEEGSYQRGAYLVDIDHGQVTAQLQTDYQQRSLVRLRLTAAGQESQESLVEQAHGTVRQAIASGQIQPEQQPIVELRIDGQVGFDRLDVDTRSLQAALKTTSNALIFLLKYEVNETAYRSPLAGLPNRHEIEKTVFTDLLAAHRNYKKRAEVLATGLTDLKDRQLSGAEEPDLYQLIETLLSDPSADEEE
ncbi:DNA repair exonuclease [filamentous cyanobacterium CCP5]|nr:DNA repair exonuclease [filamentous cyanobacterium CCP5]